MRTANKSEAKVMDSKNGGNTIFKKLFSLFGAGALLFTISVVPLPNATAAEHVPKSTQTRAAVQGLPSPGVYKVEPDHSFAYFGAWHHVVGLVRGRFDKVGGTITVSQDLASCNVDITIDTSSISTQITERDDDLRSPAFFDVKKFPTMTYRGRGIRRVSGNSWMLDGSLTIRGVTKVVPLTFTFNGSFADIPPGKPARVAFHGVAATKRADFGMTRDNLFELGASPAGPDVEIEIDVEADATVPAQ
jgi:polyisoprenoid-binding protein YceI